jgi:hypothetical protein
LYLDNEGIEKLLTSFDRDIKAIKEELLKICWFMRGGISYSEAHLLSSDERQIVGKIIEENIQVSKETGMPFF